jgi:hypothetical protein
MSGSFSDFAELKILELLVGKTAWANTTVFLALCTTLPDDTKTGATIVEVTNANSYARLTTTGAWGTAAAGAIANSSALTFATATGAGWGTIVGFALVDSGTWGAGNMLAWGSLTSKTIAAGDTASFAIGDLQITLD